MNKLSGELTKMVTKYRVINEYINSKIIETVTPEKMDDSYKEWATELKTQKATYSDAKSKSTSYNELKNQLHAKMKEHKVGIWVNKPIEIEQFTVSADFKSEVKMEGDGFTTF